MARASSPATRHRRTLSSTFVDESVAAAQALVQKWHPDMPDTYYSLFLHGANHGAEAAHFLRAAADLHRAMLFFAADGDSSHGGLVQAQALLQTAMRRLELELQLLLDDVTVDGDEGCDGGATSSSIRAVAEAMMAAGYGKECLSTFKSRRRAALAAALQRLLGFSPATTSHLHKLTWEQVDAGVVQPWLAAAAAAFGSVFPAEKQLCDAVFANDAAVAEAVFAAIAGDHAAGLLAVAEAAVARARRAPERLFRVLDVHDALARALPATASAFGGASAVAARAAAVLAKAGEAARGTLASFEAAIHKEPAKAAAAAGGAVHPLTRYVMNYLVFLADYDDALALIYEQQNVDAAPSGCASPDFSTSSSSSSSGAAACGPIGRLVMALMGKLEAKAGSYKEVALSYLFMANNTHYVVTKVRGRSKLHGVMGEDWAAAQAARARGHVDVYVRAAWGKVLAAVTTPSPARSPPAPGGVEEAVAEAVAAQEPWVAADDDMAAALRAAATAVVVPKYRMFYRRHGATVRLTPGDVTAMIASLFGGPLAQAATAAAAMAAAPSSRCTKTNKLLQEDPRSQQLLA
ncbi:hypothetical protein ACP4OV_013172 [Aristida adscensionis]